MTYNEDNLRAGLDTFTKPDKPRYLEAFKNYGKQIDEGATSKFAVEHSLTIAVRGLPDKQNKLNNALIAAEEAQLPEPVEPVQREPRTVTITVPRRPTISYIKNRFKSSKAHADDEPTLTKKLIISNLILGAAAGAVVGGLIFLVLWLLTPNLSQSVRDLFLIPIVALSIVMGMLYFYRKAIAPFLPHEVEEKDEVVSSTQSPSSERGFEGKTA
jgi:hypothetical protein